MSTLSGTDQPTCYPAGHLDFYQGSHGCRGDKEGGWGLWGTDRTGPYSPLLTRKIVQIIIVMMTMMMTMLLVIPPPHLFYIYYTQDTILSTLHVSKHLILMTTL